MFQLGFDKEENNITQNMDINDNFYMDLAVDEAWKYQGLTYPNPAVGGLILNNFGKIISISAHKKAGDSHSEVLTIQKAYFEITGDRDILDLSKSAEIHNYLYLNHNNIFKNFTIYTTLEPCNHYGKTPPCSLLIQKLGFKKVVIGVLDSNKDAEGGKEFLNTVGIETKVLNSENSINLIEPFLLWNKNRFIFFKYAQTVNGNISDGIISSKESRKFVHQIRDKIDLMVIGGNTVRVDKPTLDSRLIDGKAPDILIFSNQNNFDQNIPLFSVPNRRITVSNSLNIMKKHRYVMVEGGYSLLNAISKNIDWLLLFISPKVISTTLTTIERLNFQIIYQQQVGTDLMVWLKKI